MLGHRCNWQLVRARVADDRKHRDPRVAEFEWNSAIVRSSYDESEIAKSKRCTSQEQQQHKIMYCIFGVKICGPLFDTLLVQSQYAKIVCSTETTGAQNRISRILLRLLDSGGEQLLLLPQAHPSYAAEFFERHG